MFLFTRLGDSVIVALELVNYLQCFIVKGFYKCSYMETSSYDRSKEKKLQIH